jgi:hypothetical protein
MHASSSSLLLLLTVLAPLTISADRNIDTTRSRAVYRGNNMVRRQVNSLTTVRLLLSLQAPHGQTDWHWRCKITDHHVVYHPYSGSTVHHVIAFHHRRTGIDDSWCAGDLFCADYDRWSWDDDECGRVD